jgi:hypothetical protein
MGTTFLQVTLLIRLKDIGTIAIRGGRRMWTEEDGWCCSEEDG